MDVRKTTFCTITRALFRKVHSQGKAEERLNSVKDKTDLVGLRGWENLTF
jgi:hypothetical protein